MSATKAESRIVASGPGGVTISAEVLDELAFSERDALLLIPEGSAWRVTKVSADAANEYDGNRWYRRIYDLYAPARAGAEEDGLTEREINDAIDEALAAVRAGRD